MTPQLTPQTPSDPAVADPYYSRLADSYEIGPREDRVVWSDAPGPLTADEAGFYDANGYLFYNQLFEPGEVDPMLAEVQRLAAEADPTAPDVIIEPTNDAVRSLFRLHRTNEMLRRVCCDPRILDRARQIVGSDVYLHQSRVNFKPALYGKEFFWHSDFETWHMEDGMPRMRAVSVSINLTENHEFNGPLMVIPRSHRGYVRCVGRTPDNHFEKSLRKQEYGVPSREALETLVDDGGIEAPKGPAGSVLFFDCNTMHGSLGNLSPLPRTNLFLVFNSVENQLVEPFGGTRPRPEFLAERDVLPVAQW